MTEYLLVFYLVAPNYNSMSLKYALGPIDRDTCINMTVKAPELVRIYEINNTIYICTSVKDFKQQFPGVEYNEDYE